MIAKNAIIILLDSLNRHMLGAYGGRVARTPEGIKHLVELAEVLQARVHDQRLRMNFPTSHPLYFQPGA